MELSGRRCMHRRTTSVPLGCDAYKAVGLERSNHLPTTNQSTQAALHQQHYAQPLIAVDSKKLLSHLIWIVSLPSSLLKML
eukprot:jgi/Ulvmu1/12755/UM095_0060.1